MMTQAETSEGGGTLLPAAFKLVKHRLTLTVLEPLQLPPFKGSALRGGFGHTFKRLACTQPWPCGKYCQVGNGCAYGYIFETAPPEQAEALSNFENVPRPFVIQAPADSRTHIPPGDRLSFGLTLVGRAINHRQDFEDTFFEMGRSEGLGKTRGKYDLQAMETVLETTGEQLTTHAATLPAGRITLDFLTATRLKHRGRWIREGPPFQALIKVLLSRTSSLSYFHCGQRLDVDFRGLIDRAAGIELVDCQTRWEDWSRFSGRQKQRIGMGGLVGQATYAGDLSDYLPLLALGELIHVGKGTVFGNGQYRLGRPGPETV